MRNLLKVLALPAGLALCGLSAAHATPATSTAPLAQTDVSATPATAVRDDRHWRRDRHHRRHYAPAPRYRYGYRPYYYAPRYAPPRCYWSRYYQQRICRY